MTMPAHTLLAVLLLVPAGAAAQPTDTTDMQAALLAIRERGSSSLASAFLSQERAPRSAAELEAFADSLVAVAISYRPGDPPDRQAPARAARLALVSAARSDRAVPYTNALERLIDVYERSVEPGIKGGTLWLMTQLPNRGPVLDFLIQVASSPEVTAPIAIRYIVQEMGEAGLTRLRRLYEDGTAENPIARERLAGLAHLYGWGGRH